MKYPQPEKAKKDELKTYKELGLTRATKYRRAYGRRRVVGDGSAARPYISVSYEQYQQARLEAMRQVLLQARGEGAKLSAAATLDLARGRIEEIIYNMLAAVAQHEAILEGRMLRQEGRALSAEEKKILLADAGFEGAAPRLPRAPREALVDGLLNKIEHKQQHSPARYRAAWVQAVGPEHALATQMDRYDAATATVYFKCSNSVLSHHLQRQADLPQKLTKLLKAPVRRIRPAY
jgi:hypothetical protein